MMMFGKKKRKKDEANRSQPSSQPAPVAPGSPKSLPDVATCDDRETKVWPSLTEAFKGAIEKVAERAMVKLASAGNIAPMAFFVHADGTIKMVSLRLRGGLQEDGLIRRIREKVAAENTFAVMVLTGTDQEHGMILSGVTLGASATARVEFARDENASLKMSWLNEPLQNVLLDGVFRQKRIRHLSGYYRHTVLSRYPYVVMYMPTARAYRLVQQ